MKIVNKFIKIMLELLRFEKVEVFNRGDLEVVFYSSNCAESNLPIFYEKDDSEVDAYLTNRNRFDSFKLNTNEGTHLSSSKVNLNNIKGFSFSRTTGEETTVKYYRDFEKKSMKDQIETDWYLSEGETNLLQ